MSLRQRVNRLRRRWTPPPAVPTLPPMSPVELWRQVMRIDPDPWQELVLKSDDPRICLLCCRQAGKSQTVAIKALHIALAEPRSLILLLSRSLRQSAELGRKVFHAYEVAARGTIPSEAETKLSLELSNGSRILCLPGGSEAAIRGFSGVRCLVLDEAARIPDSLWIAVRPMLAVSGGSMMLLSTPFGQRGFFFRVWSQSVRWLKIMVTASQCPRLSHDFLQEEMIELGYFYRQEYLCEFVEAVGQVFSDAAIDAAFHEDIAPLFADQEEVDEGSLAEVSAFLVGR
jgi:Terminase large subunit, T4likevirus-type, N-terminal